MRIYIVVMALLAALGSSKAWSGACDTLPANSNISQNIEAVTSLRGALNDQGHWGICYAYAFSAFYSAIAGRDISPLHLALIHNATGGGDRAMTGAAPTGGNILNMVRALYRRDWVASNACVDARPARDELLGYIYGGHYPEGRNLVSEMQRLFPNVAGAKISRALTRLRQASGVQKDRILLKLADESCRNSPTQRIEVQRLNVCEMHYLPTPEFYNQSLVNPAWVSLVESEIVASLRQGYPVMWAYSKEFSAIYGGNAHASLIVQQREIDGSCYFVVKNSWGEEPCRVFPSRISNLGILCGGHGLPPDSFAVPRELAANATLGIQTLKAGPARRPLEFARESCAY